MSMDGKEPEFNAGVIFVGFFRWFLLLMMALVLGKGVESIARKAGGAPQFEDGSIQVHVFNPFTLEWPHIAWEWPHMAYIGGFFQLLVLILFAVRYFLCLVDPLERVGGISGDTTDSGTASLLTSSEISKALSKVTGSHILWVFIIAIPEFTLIIHASLATHSGTHWLTFLFWLVAWDTLAFFLIVPILSILWKAVVACKYCLGTLILDLRLSTLIARYGGDDKSGEILDEAKLTRKQRQIALQKLLLGMAESKLFVTAVRSYSMWNIVDLAIIIGGFGLYRLSAYAGVGAIHDLGVPAVILLLTSVAAFWNYSSQKQLWKIHIAVLSRVN